MKAFYTTYLIISLNIALFVSFDLWTIQSQRTLLLAHFLPAHRNILRAGAGDTTHSKHQTPPHHPILQPTKTQLLWEIGNINQETLKCQMRIIISQNINLTLNRFQTLNKFIRTNNNLLNYPPKFDEYKDEVDSILL